MADFVGVAVGGEEDVFAVVQGHEDAGAVGDVEADGADRRGGVADFGVVADGEDVEEAGKEGVGDDVARGEDGVGEARQGGEGGAEGRGAEDMSGVVDGQGRGVAGGGDAGDGAPLDDGDEEGVGDAADDGGGLDEGVGGDAVADGVDGKGEKVCADGDAGGGEDVVGGEDAVGEDVGVAEGEEVVFGDGAAEEPAGSGDSAGHKSQREDGQKKASRGASSAAAGDGSRSRTASKGFSSAKSSHRFPLFYAGSHAGHLNIPDTIALSVGKSIVELVTCSSLADDVRHVTRNDSLTQWSEGCHSQLAIGNSKRDGDDTDKH